MKAVLGIVAGLVTLFAAMMLVSFIGSQFIPAGAVNTSSVEAIKETYSALSTEARLMVIASWFLGVLAGALVAKKIVGRPWAPWTIAGLFEVYLLLTVLVLPMPGWMQVAGLAAPLLAGLLANHLIANRLDPAVDEERHSDRAAHDAEI